MVGSKIKLIRMERGYTLAVLAKKTGYTASFLSQIERDIKKPSLRALQIIADKLQVPIAEFFLPRQEKRPLNSQPIMGDFHITSVAKRLAVVYPDLKAKYSIITPQRDAQDDFKLLGVYICLGPGQSVSKEEEVHMTEESVYVLKGILDAIIQGRTYLLNEGDSCYICSNTPHNFTNNSDDEVELLSYMAYPLHES